MVSGLPSLQSVPDTVLNRAKELVADLSDADISLKARDIAQYSKKQEKTGRFI